MHRRLPSLVALATATVAATLGLAAGIPAGRAATPTSFTFGAAGDMGVSSAAAATLTNLHRAAPDFFLHLGDFSYGAPVPGGGATPADWCNFVKTKAALPAGYPYELVSGGHSSQASKGQDGPLESYTACLPDQLHSTVAPGSEYGKDYFFDYPADAPLGVVVRHQEPAAAGPGVHDRRRRDVRQRRNARQLHRRKPQRRLAGRRHRRRPGSRNPLGRRRNGLQLRHGRRQAL